MKFSIIIPVYNVEKYLEECINSVLSQTFTDFEVILVDDGSSDNSGKICDSFAALDGRIAVIHKENGGLSSARNSGVNAANGEYIIFLDSDDYWASNILLETASLYCSVDTVCIWRYQQSKNNGITINSELPVVEYNIKNDYKQLLRTGILFASAWYMAIPRDWFKIYDLYFEDNVISEDVEWFARLLHAFNKIVLLDAPVYVYRDRLNSISNTVSLKMVYNLEKHIGAIADYSETDGSMVLKTYLAEQTANFIIVLARYKNDYPVNTPILKEYLKHAVRKRSIVIKYAVKILDIATCCKLINLIDKIKK